jgi:putative hydroxymethylpyrimidine transport system permease protein
MTALARHTFTVILLLFLWQSIVMLWELPAYLLPSPWQVIATFKTNLSLIVFHAIPTIIEMLLGFILSILFGCLAGGMIAFFRPLNKWILPLLIISQAIPTFAIAPLLVIWLGYGMASKVATTILMTFFPITSALYDGLRETNPGWLDLAKTMNGKKWRVFYYIQIPAALPSFAKGVRIAAVVAPIGAIIGEWVGSSQGLGYLMLNANASLQIDMVFAVLLVLIILALALYFCVDKLLRTLITW